MPKKNDDNVTLLKEDKNRVGSSYVGILSVLVFKNFNALITNNTNLIN